MTIIYFKEDICLYREKDENCYISLSMCFMESPALSVIFM